MGKSSQRKGRRAELELCRVLHEYGIPAEPGDPVSYGDTPDVKGVPGIHPEVKRCEQLRLTQWMEQAVHDAEKFHDGKPCIFHRKNREEWLTTMLLSDWSQLYKEAQQKGE